MILDNSWTRSVAELRLHPATKKLLDAYLGDPAHALYISGEAGSGTGTVARNVAEQLAGSVSLVTVIGPEKGLISIERVRQLYEQTRSIQHTKRCIVIDDADTMSHDAQNALLKLLEEPVRNIHFILTTHHETQLLGTILSRAQRIQLQPIGTEESKRLLEEGGLDKDKQLQALFLAAGKPAELTRLANDPDYLATKSVLVNDARSFLQSDDYNRLSIITKYTDRLHALELLTTCGMLLRFSLLKQRNYGAADTMALLDEVMRRIEANGHVRTHLMHLVTKLP
jgi:replication-associated recombination protein RarA